MASDLSVDAPAFNPSGDGGRVGDASEHTLAAEGGTLPTPAASHAHRSSRGGGGPSLPSYMVNCYPFVQQPASAVEDGSPHGSPVDDSATLGHQLLASTKGAPVPTWPSDHRLDTMPHSGYSYPYFSAPTATASAVMMPLYGSWIPGSGYSYQHVPVPATSMPDSSFVGYGEPSLSSRALPNGAATAAAGSGRRSSWRGAGGTGRRGTGSHRGGGTSGRATATVKGSIDDHQHRHNGITGGFENNWRADEYTHNDNDSDDAKPSRRGVSVGTQNDPPWPSRAGVAVRGVAKADVARRRTQIVRDVCQQTDFSEDVANLTLQDKPSPLYADGHPSPPLNYASAVRQGRASTLARAADGLRDGGVKQEHANDDLATRLTHDYPRSAYVTAAGGRSQGAHASPRHQLTAISGSNDALDSQRERGRDAASGTAGSSVLTSRAARDGSPLDVRSRRGDGGPQARDSSQPTAAADRQTVLVSSGGVVGNGGPPDDPASSGEPTKRRRCRRGPRKGKAAKAAAAVAHAATATDSTGPASSIGDANRSSCDDVIDNDAEDDELQQREGHRRLDGAARSSLVASRVPPCNGVMNDEGGDFPSLLGSATSAEGPGRLRSAASAAAAAAHSYSQVLKSAQPRVATGAPSAGRPSAGAPLSAWAKRTQEPSGESDCDNGSADGFMFSSVAYVNRASASTGGEKRVGSGARLVGDGSGNSRGSTAAAPSAVTSASGSRRQKKVETALLAATEEQMEISLEQQVLLGHMGRMSVPAAAVAAPRTKAPSAPPTASSGRKSQQQLALNLFDMIAAAEVRKKKEPVTQQHSDSPRKSGDVATGAKGVQRGGRHGAPLHAPNALDSTAPTVKRGKERENPKPKRPSALKKVILKEREDKKHSRAAAAATSDAVAGAAAASSEGQQSCIDSDGLHANGGGNSGTAPTSSSGSSGQHGSDGGDDLLLGAAALEEQRPCLDASFEGRGSSSRALSTPGGASTQLSSRSGDAFTPASQASLPLSPISQTSPISVDALSPEISPFASEAGTPIRPLDVAKELQQHQEIAHKIHSRRFREYCDQLLDSGIDECCSTLLQELVRFQERLFARDPIKAKARRRLVLGLREVTKHLRLRKIKLVIVSPNLERIQSKGGLDEALSTIVTLCREQSVPLVFALGRRALGRACGKLVPVSVVGVFMYDGAETYFRHLMDLTKTARDAYDEMVRLVAREAADERQRVASATARRNSSSPPHPAAASSATMAAAAAAPPAAGCVGQPTGRGAWGFQRPPPEAGVKHRTGVWPMSAPADPALHQQLVRRQPTASPAGPLVLSDYQDPAVGVVIVSGKQASYRDDDGEDAEAVRLRMLSCDGDAGNEADVEDSLQDSAAAAPDGYRLMNGGLAFAGETAPIAIITTAVTTTTATLLSRKLSSMSGCGDGTRDRLSSGAGSLTRPAVGRRVQQTDAGNNAESEGSWPAGSATVTCESSSSSAAGIGDNCGSDASTTGVGGSGGGAGSSQRRSGRTHGASRPGEGGVQLPSSSSAVTAAAAAQQLHRGAGGGGGARDRVESWVAAHSSSSLDPSLRMVGDLPGVGDHLGIDDVAEFAATLSACTANSEALLLGGLAAAQPSAAPVDD